VTVRGGAATFAHQRQCDFRAFGSPHLRDRLVDADSLHALAVDLDDQVTTLDSCCLCRGVVDRGDHAHEAGFVTGDFEPDTAEFARRGLAQVLERLLVEVRRVRVEPVQHALDGVLQQRAVVHLFDVGLADLLEHVDEHAQFRERQLAALLWFIGGGIGVIELRVADGAAEREAKAEQHGGQEAVLPGEYGMLHGA
jgi:hypothetical protein